MDTATSNTGGGSAFASDSSTNLATVIKSLKKFDGKDPAEFKTWMKKFCVVLGVTRKDILPLLKKQRKPDPADTAAFDSYTRANEDLYAILFLLVELPAALSIQKHEDDTGISGDGQAAFEELCNNYDRVTDEVIRAKMEELENNPMNPGENPDDYFNQKHLLRTQLDKMGEPISDRRFKHICVQGFSDEYKDVKLMVFRDPTFNVLDMQSTMRNIFLDEQSRKGWKGRIAGRGFAMATTASDIICHGCYEPGHIRRNCPKIKNRAKKKTKPAGATKWCSKHNTTSHSDEECYQQGGKRPGDTKDSSKAFTACSNCTHCSSASNKHDSNNEVAVVDFTPDEDAFDSGFMFATCSRISGRNFAASSTGVGLLVDTGASETMFDNRLIPDGNLHDYTQRNSPKIVDVAGESQLKGTATGILHCTVKDNLRKHNVYNLVPLSSVPKGEKILGTKFVFKKKLDGRFKARLVVGGHRQEPGQDYGRSYAPVCRIGSIRITCAIGCHNNWPIYQLDVVGAFLNALCDRDVYVRPAPGTSAKNSATGEPMVYKLERSLYGLSQSPALWNDTLNESLTVFGWKRTQSDPCVYVYTSGNIIVILTVYVDDILITGGDQQLVDQKKKELTDRFEMTDMGEVKRILGIDVQRDYEQGTLAISQEHYVNTLLERFGMQEANPVSTPGYGAEISTNQPQDQILGSTDKKIYQSMTGSILYLAQCTRFDLSYAALQLSKACSNPAQVNMTAAKHVLRYLRGNPVLPIVYKRGQFRLAAFTDSSFGANPDNGRSTTGYLFFLAGGPISYGAKTQTLTAQSTVEAEIQALSYSAREAVYISNFMTELNFKTFGSVPINSDSTGALTVAGNAMHSQRTKHVALRYFFIRELVLRGQITLHHRPSEHQLADIATKYLPKHRFASIIQQIKDFSC